MLRALHISQQDQEDGRCNFSSLHCGYCKEAKEKLRGVDHVWVCGVSFEVLIMTSAAGKQNQKTKKEKRKKPTTCGEREHCTQSMTSLYVVLITVHLLILIPAGWRCGRSPSRSSACSFLKGAGEVYETQKHQGKMGVRIWQQRKGIRMGGIGRDCCWIMAPWKTEKKEGGSQQAQHIQTARRGIKAVLLSLLPPPFSPHILKMFSHF